MSLTPQSFLEVAYGVPPIVGSAWGLVKVIAAIRNPSAGSGSDRDRMNRAELERTRWEALIGAIQTVGKALEAEAAIVAKVRESQVRDLIPSIQAVHDEVVGRREEHARLMQDLMDVVERRRKPRET